MPKIRIVFKRSVIGYPDRQRDTIRSLGLRRVNDSVVREDSPALRGMIDKVRHLIEVEEEAAE